MGLNLTKRVQGWQDEHRARIAVSKLLDRLHDHAFSKHELMSPSQVATAFGLLRKALPDLNRLEIESTSQHAHTVQFQWLPPEQAEPAQIIDGTASELSAPAHEDDNLSPRTSVIRGPAHENDEHTASQTPANGAEHPSHRETANARVRASQARHAARKKQGNSESLEALEALEAPKCGDSTFDELDIPRFLKRRNDSSL